MAMSIRFERCWPRALTSRLQTRYRCVWVRLCYSSEDTLSLVFPDPEPRSLARPRCTALLRGVTTKRSRSLCKRVAPGSACWTRFATTTEITVDTDASCSQNNRTPLQCARPGSATQALLTEMEIFGAELTKSAAKLT